MEESKQITFPHEPVEVSAQFARSAWFRKDRFGMFIHWGVYAVPGRGEWVHSTAELTVEDYQPFVEAFNPQDVDFTAWAKLAKEAGMQYAVFTAKHHDGYAMFDTASSDYSSVAGPRAGTSSPSSWKPSARRA